MIEHVVIVPSLSAGRLGNGIHVIFVSTDLRCGKKFRCGRVATDVSTQAAVGREILMCSYEEESESKETGERGAVAGSDNGEAEGDTGRNDAMS